MMVRTFKGLFHLRVRPGHELAPVGAWYRAGWREDRCAEEVHTCAYPAQGSEERVL
jgi:hypothetical protein